MSEAEVNQGAQAGRGHALAARLVAQPRRAVLALAAVQLVAWTILPYLVSSAPPIDAIEGMIWGKEWLLGTHKHPTLPAWLVEISFQVTHDPILGPYILSQISVGLTYIFVFATGSILTTKPQALIGVLLLTPIVYFTWLSPEFNHNVIQLPVWSAAILLFTMARQRPLEARAWLLLGVVVGIGIYAKHSVVILYALFVIWTLADKSMRVALARPWPWLAIIVAVLVASPQLIWLVRNDFPTASFVAARGGGSGSLLSSLHWLAAQTADHLPLLIFFLLVGYRSVWRLPRVAAADPHLRYIAFFALGPAIVTVLLSMVTGIGLRDMWGMPLFTLSGLLIVSLLGREWSMDVSVRALKVAILFVAALAIIYSGFVALSPRFGYPQRNAWPMREIAEKAEAAWSSRTDAPLRIVSGKSWLAGLVAAGSPERPSVVFDGMLSVSPWLTAERLSKEGVLYIWSGEKAPAELLPDDPTLDIGSFPVEGTTIPSGRIGYAVQLPKP